MNEQLGQLYMDMQLEGAGDRLHIEGGSTASSSSEDESSSVNPKGKKVREILFRGFWGLSCHVCLPEYRDKWGNIKFI